MFLTLALLASGGLSRLHSVTPQVFEIELPSTNSAETFTWLEWSPDLEDWTPVARDYGQGWENSYPELLPIIQFDGLSMVEDPIDEPARFFRVRSADTAPATLSNAESAARFLQQATFGPTLDTIESFPGVTEEPSDFNRPPYAFFEAWIDAEIAKPASSHRAFWRQRSNPDFTAPQPDSPFPDSPYEVANTLGHQLQYHVGKVRYPVPGEVAMQAGRLGSDNRFAWTDMKRIVWYDRALQADDALRQRMAWCLSQIFVLGESGSVHTDEAESFLVFYDIFVRNAFGNFGDVLKEVTFSPRMADYLTYLDNQKSDGTRFPDENYAREVMQLFTIGLWELNQNGTRKLDGSGAPIPTYDNDDIEEFARIFTGLKVQPVRPNIEYKNQKLNLIDPLRVEVVDHDFGEKTLLDGTTLGPYPENERTGALARAEINAFLDHLVAHENTAPFIARLLIQRLTLSNPSPRYIQAVAEAFASGTYRSVGSGQRGDLTATLKAILLHPEAREPALALDEAHGKLREPLIRFLSYARALRLTSVQTFGLFPIDGMSSTVFQEPYNSPSVFNFYLSDHEPNGVIQDRGLVAPEFGIVNDISSIGFINAIYLLLQQGLQRPIGVQSYPQAYLDLSYEVGIAGDADALLDHLDRLLTAGRLSDANRVTLKDALETLPASERRQRVEKALWLFSILPEFNILY